MDFARLNELRLTPAQVRDLMDIPATHLEFLVRSGVVDPFQPSSQGVGRVYSFTNLIEIRLAIALVNLGVSIERIGLLFTQLRDRDSGTSQLQGFDLLYTDPREAELLVVTVDLSEKDPYAHCSAFFTGAKYLEGKSKHFDIVVVRAVPLVLDIARRAIALAPKSESRKVTSR